MNFKKRIAVFLCLLLTLPAILGALPQAALEVQAATTVYFGWNLSGYNDERELQVTKKTTSLYMGDYVYAYSYGNKYKNYSYLSLNSGVKYTSSTPSVASVNSTTGLVTPKKTGSTKITITFKGAKTTCTIKVVSSLGEGTTVYKQLEKDANAFIKAYGKGVTKANRYNVMSARNVYWEEYSTSDYSYTVSKYSGTESVSEQQKDGTYRYYYKAHMPVLAHAYALNDAVYDYVKTVNPVGTKPAKIFKISSISGKGTTVTAKVSQKVTENQIFGIKAGASTVLDTCLVKNNKASFPVWVKDTNTGHKYYATATATKGSKSISIKLNQKLTKGHTYKLIGYRSGLLEQAWTNQGKTSFKAQ